MNTDPFAIRPYLERVWVPGWVWLAACILAAWALFTPLLTSEMPFLCDDYAIITTNVDDQGLSVDRMVDQFLVPPYGVSSRYYRPVFYLSYALDFMVGGVHPLAYYLINVLYHGLAAWLLFLLLRLLGAGRFFALVTLAVFLCHPIHIESVTWIAGRSSSMAALFFLGGLAAFAWYRRRPRWSALAVMVFSLAMGLLTKETVVLFPGMMLAVDLLVRPGRSDPDRADRTRRTRHALAPYGAALLVLAAYFVARNHAVGSAASGYGRLLGELFRKEGLEFCLYSLSRYFVPVSEGVTGRLPWWGQLLVALPSVALLLRAFFQLRYPAARGLVLTGLCLFLLTTVPSLPILRVSPDLMNSRFFYLPSAGLCMLLTAGALSFSRASLGREGGRLPFKAALAVVILGGAAFLMINQGGVVEAGRVCRSFLAAVRGAGYPVLVAPRHDFFPYADREGDGVKNDDALFLPANEAKEGAPQDGAEGGKLALLINAPRVVEGSYVFWGGLDMALRPLFGKPGVDLLFTELSPVQSPEGSFFGVLLRDGVPLLKWDGSGLIPATLGEGQNGSAVARDLTAGHAAPLGLPGLLSGRRYAARLFRPVMTLPAPPGPLGAYRYRTLTPFGANTVKANPVREGDRLRFDPWNEPDAGPLFKGVETLKSGIGLKGYTTIAFDHLYCILFIEGMEDGKVTARSRHLLLRIDFTD